MKELIGFAVMLTLGFAFLWGFSTRPGVGQASERINYYQSSALRSASQGERDAWEELVASQPVTSNCSAKPYPRPTRLPFLGASVQEASAWQRSNEIQCVSAFARRMRLMGNAAGQHVAQVALGSLAAAPAG